MIQLARMAAVSLLTGCIAAGAVWLAWDLGYRFKYAARQRQERRKRAAEAIALPAQAGEPGPEERPRQRDR